MLVEALLLGAVGIPCGMLLGIGGTAAVLGLTGAGFSALLGVGEGLSLAVEPVSLIVSAVLSLITLLVSAWIPALRAGRVSAVDAIRQVQDVKLPRRAERRLAKARARAAGSGAAAAGSDAAAAVSAPVPFSKRGDRGLWGAVAGVPGILAHRSLSRQSARGRIVVMSLAVSVVLVVTAGAVALTMDPIANRAASAAGASADADVTMMASSSDVRNDDLYLQAGSFDRLSSPKRRNDGMRLAGSVRQGGMEVRIPPACSATPDVPRSRTTQRRWTGCRNLSGRRRVLRPGGRVLPRRRRSRSSRIRWAWAIGLRRPGAHPRLRSR